MTEASTPGDSEEPFGAHPSKTGPIEESTGEMALLVKSAKRGDETAWRNLIKSLYPKVIAIVRNHLPVSEDEEDIVQDIFVKVFLRLDQYRGWNPISHWVSPRRPL